MLAIRELQAIDMSPVEKIVLSREYDISGRRTVIAYAALCERPDPLTIAEASELGLETAMRIAQLHEQLRWSGRSAVRAGYQSLTSTAAIRRDLQETEPVRVERIQCDIGRGFFDQGPIISTVRPPVHTSASRKIDHKSCALSSSARFIAEAFGLDIH
ncbi:hypothetical protein AcV7_001989 [Taiwanofungus camphoratus]|nr:hypothetical protein AcV7_001989 [Antrodia cinnamomea]